VKAVVEVGLDQEVLLTESIFTRDKAVIEKYILKDLEATVFSTHTRMTTDAF
jgi:hypothetical protein